MLAYFYILFLLDIYYPYSYHYFGVKLCFSQICHPMSSFCCCNYLELQGLYFQRGSLLVDRSSLLKLSLPIACFLSTVDQWLCCIFSLTYTITYFVACLITNRCLYLIQLLNLAYFYPKACIWCNIYQSFIMFLGYY